MSKRCFSIINFIFLLTFLLYACSTSKTVTIENPDRICSQQLYGFSETEENVIREDKEIETPNYSLQSTKVYHQKICINSSSQPKSKKVAIKHPKTNATKSLVVKQKKNYFPSCIPVFINKGAKSKTYSYIIISAAIIGALLIFFGYGLILDVLLTIGVFLLLAIVFDLLAAIPYWHDDKMLLWKFYGQIAIIALIAGVISAGLLYLVIVVDLSFLGLILIVLLTFLSIVFAFAFAAAALAWLTMTIVEKRKSAQ